MYELITISIFWPSHVYYCEKQYYLRHESWIVEEIRFCCHQDRLHALLARCVKELVKICLRDPLYSSELSRCLTYLVHLSLGPFRSSLKLSCKNSWSLRAKSRTKPKECKTVGFTDIKSPSGRTRNSLCRQRPFTSFHWHTQTSIKTPSGSNFQHISYQLGQNHFEMLTYKKVEQVLDKRLLIDYKSAR